MLLSDGIPTEDVLGFRTHSAVHKRIKRIQQQYLDFDPDFKKESFLVIDKSVVCESCSESEADGEAVCVAEA